LFAFPRTHPAACANGQAPPKHLQLQALRMLTRGASAGGVAAAEAAAPASAAAAALL